MNWCIVFYEYKKLLLNRKALIFIFLSLLINTMVVWNTFKHAEYDLNDKNYLEYNNRLQGVLNDEKEIFIKNEYQDVTVILENYDEVVEMYKAEKIDKEEFIKYNEKYQYAINMGDSFDRVNEKYEYFKSVQNEKLEFFYDTDWIKLLAYGKINIITFIITTLLLIPFFTMEHVSGVGLLQKSSLSGRWKIHIYKTIIATLVMLSIAIVIIITEIVFARELLYLPEMNAPIQSIKEFRKINATLSISDFYMFSIMIRTFGVIALTALISVFSYILIKPINLIAAITAIFFIPVLIRTYIPEILYNFSYSALFTNGVVVNQPLVNILGLYISQTIFIILYFIVVTILLFFVGYKTSVTKV